MSVLIVCAAVGKHSNSSQKIVARVGIGGGVQRFCCATNLEGRTGYVFLNVAKRKFLFIAFQDST